MLKTCHGRRSKAEYAGVQVERLAYHQLVNLIDASVYSYTNSISKLYVEIAEYILHEWRYQPWIFQKF